MSHEGGTPHIPSPEWADLATFPTKNVSALWWQISDVRLILPAILRPWRVMWGGPLGLLGLGVSFYSYSIGDLQILNITGLLLLPVTYCGEKKKEREQGQHLRTFFFLFFFSFFFFVFFFIFLHEVQHNIKKKNNNSLSKITGFLFLSCGVSCTTEVN